MVFDSYYSVNDFTVTFASSTSGQIIASVGGPQPNQLIVTANNYTTLATDKIIKVTTAAKIITLLTAVGNTGREFIIHNSSPGNITVNCYGAETINNQSSQLLPTHSSIVVYSDGSNYWII